MHTLNIQVTMGWWISKAQPALVVHTLQISTALSMHTHRRLRFLVRKKTASSPKFGRVHQISSAGPPLRAHQVASYRHSAPSSKASVNSETRLSARLSYRHSTLQFRPYFYVRAEIARPCPKWPLPRTAP